MPSITNRENIITYVDLYDKYSKDMLFLPPQIYEDVKYHLIDRYFEEGGAQYNMYFLAYLIKEDPKIKEYLGEEIIPEVLEAIDSKKWKKIVKYFETWVKANYKFKHFAAGVKNFIADVINTIIPGPEIQALLGAIPIKDIRLDIVVKTVLASIDILNLREKYNVNDEQIIEIISEIINDKTKADISIELLKIYNENLDAKTANLLHLIAIYITKKSSQSLIAQIKELIQEAKSNLIFNRVIELTNGNEFLNSY